MCQIHKITDTHSLIMLGPTFVLNTQCINNAWLMRRYIVQTFHYEICVELILLLITKIHCIKQNIQRHCYFLFHFLYLLCSCLNNLIKDIFMLTFNLRSH